MLFDSTNDGAGVAAGMGAVVIIIGLVVELALVAFGIYLYMRVARKAGYPFAYGLLMLIPLANLVFIVLFAFQEWPIERRLREAGLSLDGGPTGSAPQYGMPTTPYPGPATYPPSTGGYPAAPGTSYPPAGGTSYPPAGGTSYPPAGGTSYPPAGGTSYPPAGGSPYAPPNA